MVQLELFPQSFNTIAYQDTARSLRMRVSELAPNFTLDIVQELSSIHGVLCEQVLKEYDRHITP